MPDYNGLTRNQWPGTWSPSSDHPIVLDTEIRGGLRYVSGNSGDRLSDITGQRLQDGMVVYVENGYTEGSVTYQSGQYYKYNVLSGESRDTSTGVLPNDSDNWEFFKPDLTGFVYDSSSGLITITTSDGSTFTDSINLNAFSISNLSEGTNLYFTTARADSDAKNAISLTFTGGDGAASYTPATGVISVTGPSASEVRAHFTANKGLSVTSGEFNIDSSNVRGMFSGGTGITYNSGTGEFTTTDGDIVHDNLSGFVANEHIDHTSVSVIAGKGLTGGGTIAADRTIDIDSANVRGMFSGSNGITYNSGTGDIRAAQPLDSAANPTFNQLRGPATFVIDPAAIGDATGTVQILGNLQVDGTTTTINSTDVTIDDKTFTLADNAADSSALNSGGIIWGGSSIVDKPSFTYNHASARFDANRTINATSFIGNVTGTLQTAAQPNITSVGNLTALRVDGEIDARGGITDNAGPLVLQAKSGEPVRLRNHSGNNIITASDAGVAKLNYTSSTKLETNAYGVTVTGTVNADSATFTNVTGTIQTAAQPNIDHDQLTNFVSNEHINHTSVSVIAGKGLSGGGTIASSRTIDIDSANVRGMFSGGTGITYNSGTGEFTTTDGDIVHDNLSGFVANEHIDHSGVSIVAGKGLSGGGTIASSRTIDIDSANIQSFMPKLGTDFVDSAEVNILIDARDTHDSAAVQGQIDSSLDNLSSLTVTGSLIADSATINGNVELISTDTGTTGAPVLSLYRNSSSPADNDNIGEIVFKGRNDADQDVDYAKITTQIADASDGTEDTRLKFQIPSGGTIQTPLEVKFGRIYSNADIYIEAGKIIRFEGTTADSFETVLSPGDPTADRTITLPDATGTILLSDGDGSSLTNVDAETLDGINSTSFLRSDADDEFTGTITGVGDGTNPTIGIRGGGPNFIRFYDTLDASDNVNAIDIKYRRTPNDLLIERASNNNIIAEFGGDDGHAALYFDNSKKLETNVYGATVTGTINADSATISGPTLIGGNGSTGGITISDGLIDMRTGTGNVSKIKFYCETNNAHFQTLQAQPHSAGSSAVITLPQNTGTLALTSQIGLLDHHSSADSAAILTVGGTGSLTGVSGAFTADSASVNILNIPTGSGTGNRIQVGDDLLLFDDGNAHIHSKNSVLWLNAQTGEQVRINNQYNGAVYLSRPAGEGVVIKEHYDLTSDSSQLSTLTQTAIASFSSSTYTGGKFLITAHDHTAGSRQISELLVLRDSAAGTAHATEYGQIYTSGVLATYDVDINGGNIRVLATSASTNATTYQVAETLMRD